MNSKAQLLSTAALASQLIDKAEEKGVAVDIIPFIHVEFVENSALSAEVEQLCSQKLTVVFTSANAVSAISRYLYINKPDWNIYCVGNVTRNTLLDYVRASAIKGVANNAEALAGIILQNNIASIVFFCGANRMDTLPHLVSKQGIGVKEVIVYKTTETPEAVTKQYNGILFFSPSAVDSFFSVNAVPPSAVLFAIGNTTAAALQEKSACRIVVSPFPSKEQLVMQVIQYFQKEAFTDACR